MDTDVLAREFAAQVRDVLAHLLDPVHLQSHPLAASLVAGDVHDPGVRAQLLREAVLQAIADLKPAGSVPSTDPAARPHTILSRKYIQGFSNEEIQEELLIGRRQFFREQRRAVEALTDLLWQRRVGTEDPAGQHTLAEELDDLGLEPRTFQLTAALSEALRAVRPLADERGVVLSLAARPPVEVFCDEDIARQLLVSLISAVIRLCPNAYVDILPRSRGRWVSIAISSEGFERGLSRSEEELDVPAGLASRLGGRLYWDAASQCLVLDLPSAQREHILVVDDNPKTLRLFRRYLEPHRFRVSEVQESTLAFDTIARLKPDAVILDIMMRSVDGWKVLQTLKADSQTRSIPVIVCSVLAEEDLARTVGADAYLRKPVTQSSLLTALTRLLG
ncbi:MAG: response regulator [Anaerolineae bacterium]